MPTLPTGLQHWEEPPSSGIRAPGPTEAGTLMTQELLVKRRKSENPVPDKPEG